jgi:hypothetical protein
MLTTHEGTTALFALEEVGLLGGLEEVLGGTACGTMIGR